MKNLYYLAVIGLFIPLHAQSQSEIYSVPVVAINKYLRDSVNVLGRLDLDFPEDWTVFVQFDGEGFGSPLDRIILAANIYPDWDTNDGNVSFMSGVSGAGYTFSHTRTFPVTAGRHSFYAVAHNYVDTEGTGIATIYGTLSVEFIPQTSGLIAESSITVSEFEAIQPVAFDSVTIEATGPGKIEVRLNGAVDCNQGDIIVMAVTETTNWNYTDPHGIALETNNTVSPYVVLSTTRVFDVDGAGIYTFYAMGQRGYEEESNGFFYAYTNLHARYYPDDSDNDLEGKWVDKESIQLNDLRLLDSIELDIPEAGKVEVRFDGILRSPPGKNILIAANNNPGYELQEGRVLFWSPDKDVDRHPFVHTQVFDVEPGLATFYVMAEHYQNAGTTTVDIHGHFLVKFYPESIVATHDQIAELPIEIWPNPAKDQISIQCENANDVLDVSIFDLQGRQVQQMNNILPEEELEISSLNSGMYIVQVSNGKETGFRKLVKE